MPSTQFSTETPLMTAKEAEDVIALWSQRFPSEPVLPSTSVHDIAEALSAPPDEVLKMLAQIRNQPKKKNPAGHLFAILKWLFVGAVAIAVMVGLFFAGVSMERSRNYRMPAAERPYQAAVPPPGYKVSFDGYAIMGGQMGQVSVGTPQDSMELALRRAVREMEPGTDPYTNGSGPTIEQLGDVKKSFESQKDIEGLLVFKDAWISKGGTEIKGKIPVSVASGPQFQLDELVHNEQDRQIRRMVSQLMLKIPTK